MVRGHRRLSSAATLCVACAAQPPAFPEGGDSSTGAPATSVASMDDGGSSTTAPGGAETSSSGSSTTASDTTAAPPLDVVLDILIVVDNSPGMAGPQQRLATAFPSLVTALRDVSATLDVQVMVTTTDVGHPGCATPAGYQPALGSPIGIPCTEHLSDFTSLGGESFPEACTTACPVPTLFEGDFIRFTDVDDNVLRGTPEDALRCLIPQGLVGCGYEAPLEAMFNALSVEACWNQDGGCDGAQSPFLRAGADLVVMLLTNELDCSLTDPAIVNDPSFQNVNPTTGLTTPSSAVCFNAGVACAAPVGGLYPSCIALADDNLHVLSRYTELLDGLMASGKTLTFVPIVGFSPRGPDATEYREWIDGPYPMGDILPADIADGMDAADKTFQLGIGPGCTAETEIADFVQALPPVRIRELCETVDGEARGRCCPTSICDDVLENALQCVTDHVMDG